jgi:hypothetical protein
VNIDSQIHYRGNVTIEARDVNTGKLVARRKVKNLVVTTGRGLTADVLLGVANRPSHLAVGSNNTAVALTDTTLVAEAARIALTSGSRSSNVLTFYAYLPGSQGNGVDLKECGIFNSSSGGTLFARATFSSISKTSSIAVTFTWQFTITSS